MKEIYTVMSATLGVPPPADEKFVWDYYDKGRKPRSWKDTARELYKVFAKYSVSVATVAHPKMRRVTDFIRIASGLILAHQRPVQWV